ncbi:Ceramide synthase 2 [Conglomerata obtusa]
MCANIIAPYVFKRSSMSEKEKLNILQKFKGTFCRFIAYTFLILYGCYALYNQNWLIHPRQYCLLWKNNDRPIKITRYYLTELIHYILSFVFLFLEPKMKDFFQMFLHHIITIYLIVSSHHKDLHRFGVAIMILHDLSDPIMEFGKICFYLKKQYVADIAFVIFSVVFVINRCLLYPIFIIYPVFRDVLSVDKSIEMLLICLCLVLLLIINLMWAAMILKMAIRMINDGFLKVCDIRVEEIDEKRSKKRLKVKKYK